MGCISLSPSLALLTFFNNNNNNNNNLWKEIKALKTKKESLPPTAGGTSGESNIANLWKDHFSAIASSVGSTDDRDQVMNALGTVQGHNDVINVPSAAQVERHSEFQLNF